MDLVDDENLVAVTRRPDGQSGDDHLADIVDSRMCRRVDFEHVDVARFGNFNAGVAPSARVGRRALLAIERARENPRGRRLTDAARPRKDERLREPPARERVFQRPRHRQLSDDIVEPLRPPFARDHLIGHGNVRTEPRPGRACGTFQDLLSAAAFRP